MTHRFVQEASTDAETLTHRVASRLQKQIAPFRWTPFLTRPPPFFPFPSTTPTTAGRQMVQSAP